MRPFVEEYLTLSSSETIQQATQRTEVDLKLKIGGTLFKPEISFDLNFPNIVGELGAIVDNKKRITQTNQLELNNQVVGLIVWNSFIPSNNLADAIGTSALQNAGINTLSEFLTSQFSVYITNIINNALAEKGLSAGIDFEVGLRNNMLAVGNTNNSILPDELEIRFSTPLSFLDDKVSLNIGGNYVFQNQGLTINQILPDFALELQLTDDRKLKARLYGKTDLDVVTITNLRQKYGIGIGYRTEFGAMVDFKDKIKEGLDKLTE